jgi:hypothetical protein
LAGVRGAVLQRLCGAEGWEFGGDPVGLWSMALAGLRSWPKDQRSRGLWSSSFVGLWGVAWHAAPAVLFVNHGVEKPSRS